MNDIVEDLQKINTKSKIISYISDISKEELYNFICICNDKYHNEESIISDKKFDIIYDYYNSKYNNLSLVGSKIRESDISIKLPFYMGSLNKIKKDNIKELLKWIEKNNSCNYIIMDKLDGVSCLLISDDNGNINLYTRGNGKIGKDISHIKEYINFLPDKLKPNLAFRGELIISKENFSKLDCEKINARNTVSGCINSKTYKDTLKYIDFIVYEDMNTNNFNYSIKSIKDNNLKCVKYIIIDELNEEILSKKLNEFKNTSNYDIDGIVISTCNNFIRQVDKNPYYSFAYKEDTYITCEVLEVLWEESRYGILKPRVRINPIYLSGVTITYITAHNAKYINENKIGKGSIIEITRSGEVIPYISNIIKCSEKSDLPMDIEYEWNNTNIDIISKNQTSEVKIKNILYFFDTIEAKNISIETIRKIYNHGYITIKKILDMKVKDFLEINGFQIKLAEKIYKSIHDSLNNIKIEVLMCASTCFGYGIGVKNLSLLLDSIPDIISRYDDIKMQNIKKLFESKDHISSLYESIIKIEGYSEIRTNKIIEGLPKFINFYRLIKNYVNLSIISANIIPENSELYNKKICISGFRGILDKKIEEKGGIIVSSISSKTFCLIVKDKNDSTSKISNAISKSIPIYDIEEFQNKYL